MNKSRDYFSIQVHSKAGVQVNSIYLRNLSNWRKSQQNCAKSEGTMGIVRKIIARFAVNRGQFVSELEFKRYLMHFSIRNVILGVVS